MNFALITEKQHNILLSNFINNLSNKSLYLGSKNIDNSYINIIAQDINCYSFLFNCLKKTNKILLQNKSHLLTMFVNKDGVNWFIDIYDGIMFNLPFTLNKTIFIPYEYLKKLCKNNDFIGLSNTLIHELIHVYQRSNIILWINIIKLSCKNWILITKKDELYHKLVAIPTIINPDTYYDFIYLYNNENNLYYGTLYLNSNNNISTKWYIIKDKNVEELKNEIVMLPDEESPLETLAYNISNFVLYL